MGNFKVGFSSINIDGPLNIGIEGYYVPRYSKGVLDSIEAQCLALKLKDKTVILVSVETCMLHKETIDKIADNIEKTLGVKADDLIMSATHTHTAPMIKGVTFSADKEPLKKYESFLVDRVTECAKNAICDLANAKMGYAIGYAPEKVAYIRRYKMKDGSTMTCPPIDDPNIDYPLGDLDQRVNVLRFDREGKESIVLLNYGVHVDTVNGEYISADWPGWLRKTLDLALDGVKCMVICGAQGDVGSTNVHPVPGDMNDTEISFDNEMKSPGMARFVGRALAGTVLQVYDKVIYTDVNNLDVVRLTVNAPTNRATEEELVLAHKYKELHESGRDDLIPYTAMELTTVVAEALRMCNFEFGPDYIPLELVGLKIGNVALVGMPGEPFTEIGVEIKKEKGFDNILPCALTNGYNGYFPTLSAFNEGGYEAKTSEYKAGVDKLIIEGAKEVLKKLKG